MRLSSPAASARMRASCGRACAGPGTPGSRLDDERNKAARGNVAEIQEDGAPVRLLIVRTNEEFEIAQQTMLSIEKWKEH